MTFNDNRIEIRGKVIHGNHFGKTLGFPTANLDRRDYNRKNLRLKFGIYAGHVQVDGYKKHKAAIVIGPLDNKGLSKLEAHLIGFSGNLYGKKVVLYIEKFVRPWKQMKNVAELKKQIAADISKIKRL